MSESFLFDDPFEWFQEWYDKAREADIPNFNAVALATSSADARPSVRMVLLKEVSRAGFVFYTNRKSRKGEDLQDNPTAAICLYWPELPWQIRIEGNTAEIDGGHADEYFETRPRESQLGAWASKQSRPLVEGRRELLRRYREEKERFADRDVPRPRYWTGFRLVPTRYEFWRRRAHRLNDRWEFTRESPELDWTRRSLFP